MSNQAKWNVISSPVAECKKNIVNTERIVRYNFEVRRIGANVLIAAVDQIREEFK